MNDTIAVIMIVVCLIWMFLPFIGVFIEVLYRACVNTKPTDIVIPYKRKRIGRHGILIVKTGEVIK